MKKLIPSILIVLLTSGCEEEVEKPTQAVKINGVVAMGQLVSGTVTAYDYSGCAKGEKLASVGLNNRRDFILSVGARETDHPILFELSNFKYIEQWSEREVSSIDKPLYSVLVVESGDPEKDVNLSFWTHLSSALTAQKCAANVDTPVAHIEDANTIFSDALTFDINEDKPLLISNFEAPEFSVREIAGARYGIANAAVASYTYDFDARSGDTATHEIYNSIALADLAYSDLSFEGYLNGINEGGEIPFWDVTLSADVYRTDLPNHMQAIIQNLTGLPSGIDANFLTGVIDSFHGSSATGIFGFSEPAPLGDIPAPELRGLTVSNCSTAAVGSCCGGTFSDPETVYRTSATVEYDVIDFNSTYQVTSISSNPAGLEYALPLSSEIVENEIVPWRSGKKTILKVSQDSTGLEIRALTAVFTNDAGKTLSVTKTIYGNTCTTN